MKTSTPRPAQIQDAPPRRSPAMRKGRSGAPRMVDTGWGYISSGIETTLKIHDTHITYPHEA